jgi:outer membrane protein insertion porin family
LQIGRPLFELFSTSFTYRFEDVSIHNVNPAVQSYFTDGITSAGLVGLVRDARDNRQFTKRGSYNGVFLELAGGPFGGDNEYFKVQTNSRFYFPVWRDVIFSAQGRFGYIGSVNGEPVPIFERFFLGGINSIRGYRSRSIGPTRQVASLDPAASDFEFIVGGNKELILNHELTFPLVPQVNIRGLAFFDAGNAYDDGQSIDLSELRLSWGLGIRWYSPLGPLRFEFGFPINPQPGDETSAFEFSIGSSF